MMQKTVLLKTVMSGMAAKSKTAKSDTRTKDDAWPEDDRSVRTFPKTAEFNLPVPLGRKALDQRHPVASISKGVGETRQLLCFITALDPTLGDVAVHNECLVTAATYGPVLVAGNFGLGQYQTQTIWKKWADAVSRIIPKELHMYPVSVEGRTATAAPALLC